MKKLLMILFCILLVAGCAAKKVENMEVVMRLRDVDRTGSYTGEVKDGIPHGNGVFTTVNSAGEQWVYTGEFKNGMFDGQGVQEWDFGQIKEGLFKENIWQPTSSQMFRYIASANASWKISEKANQYLQENEDVFISRNADKLEPLVNHEITPEAIRKDPMAFGDELVELNDLLVIKKDENSNQSDMMGYWLSDGSNLYIAYFFQQLPELEIEDIVKRFYGLPLSIFMNDSISTSPTIVFAGCYVEKY